MELFILFLLLGLAGLAAANLYLFSRVNRLEKQVVTLRPAQADPVGRGSDAGVESAAGPPPPPPRETVASLFEQLVGGRLLIWIGGNRARRRGLLPDPPYDRDRARHSRLRG